MNNPTSQEARPPMDRAQLMSAMFAQLVIQHTNMALIFLGLEPNPQTGETQQDLDHARYFIDQLEMLEIKTKGNLDKNEEALMKQSLTSLRLAFVEAVSHPKIPSTPAPAPPDKQTAPATDEQEMPIVEPALPGETTPPAEPEAESRKKFSKKY